VSTPCTQETLAVNGTPHTIAHINSICSQTQSSATICSPCEASARAYTNSEMLQAAILFDSTLGIVQTCHLFPFSSLRVVLATCRHFSTNPSFSDGGTWMFKKSLHIPLLQESKVSFRVCQQRGSCLTVHKCSSCMIRIYFLVDPQADTCIVSFQCKVKGGQSGVGMRSWRFSLACNTNMI
jgi:hypothetical protein